MCSLLEFVVGAVFGFRGLSSSSVFVPSTAYVLVESKYNFSMMTQDKSHYFVGVAKHQVALKQLFLRRLAINNRRSDSLPSVPKQLYMDRNEKKWCDFFSLTTNIINILLASLQ